MKKITTMILALMVVLFTQCKKDNLDNTDSNTDTDVRKVKVRCEIPMGGDKGAKSDFANLMIDGSIKWSTGTERIYLAVHHGTNPQIVELTAETTSSATTLAFEGEVDETILTDGSFTLPLHGTLKNQMAIAYMDWEGVTKLSGTAIVGTGYTLAYSEGGYNFVVDNETSVINIGGTNDTPSKSFVVL